MHSNNNKTSKIDQLLTTPKQVLHRTIQYQKAKNPAAMDIIGKNSHDDEQQQQQHNNSNHQSKKQPGSDANSLTLVRAYSSGGSEVQLEADVKLFPVEKARELMGWKSISKIGSGLQNLGNTCFCNAVLQCLTYTPVFANYCLSEEHSNRCRANDFCAMCEMTQHVKRVLSSSKPYSPVSLVRKFKLIGKQFRLGRQEDSHEFLRYLIDAVQTSVLKAAKVNTTEHLLARTSVIHSIFGGYLRSEVCCLTCKRKSWTYDPILDLSLEIANCDSVSKALQKFSSSELLDGNNRYRCEACKKLVAARKQFTIWRLPNILVIHLKRFEFSIGAPFRGKIKKPVTFTTTLDMSKFVSADSQEAHEHIGFQYSLYGVLVHQGATSRCGHYFSFVKGSNGVWYETNDELVRQVSEHHVLNQQAYILFYARNTSSNKNGFVADPPRPLNGVVAHSNSGMNGTVQSSDDVGLSVARAHENGMNGKEEEKHKQHNGGKQPSFVDDDDDDDDDDSGSSSDSESNTMKKKNEANVVVTLKKRRLCAIDWWKLLKGNSLMRLKMMREKYFGGDSIDLDDEEMDFDEDYDEERDGDSGPDTEEEDDDFVVDDDEVEEEEEESDSESSSDGSCDDEMEEEDLADLKKSAGKILKNFIVDDDDDEEGNVSGKKRLRERKGMTTNGNGVDSKKTNAKNKKNKKKRNFVVDEEEDSSSSDESGDEKSKKKKKKAAVSGGGAWVVNGEKPKMTNDDDDDDDGEDDSDEDMEPAKPNPMNGRNDSESSSSSSSSDDDYDEEEKNIMKQFSAAVGEKKAQQQQKQQQDSKINNNNNININNAEKKNVKNKLKKQGQYGTTVDQWDDIDVARSVKEQKQILRQPELQDYKMAMDEHDANLDKGRVKKVKNKKEKQYQNNNAPDFSKLFTHKALEKQKFKKERLGESNEDNNDGY